MCNHALPTGSRKHTRTRLPVVFFFAEIPPDGGCHGALWSTRSTLEALAQVRLHLSSRRAEIGYSHLYGPCLKLVVTFNDKAAFHSQTLFKAVPPVVAGSCAPDCLCTSTYRRISEDHFSAEPGAEGPAQGHRTASLAVLAASHC